MEKIKLYKVYYVFNKDLGLDDKVLGHEVLVVKKSKDGKRVKVKTITSLESASKKGEKRKLKNTKKDLISLLYNGEIIVIPNKYLNTPKLSGIYIKGIWVETKKLIKSKYDTKISRKYLTIIGK